jgi:hypothetical protein
VLLKMDEFQGRLGPPGALVRKGERPESSVLPALPVPVVIQPALAAPRPGDAELGRSPELRAALRAMLGEGDLRDIGCSEFDRNPNEPLKIIGRLDQRRVLVSTLCYIGSGVFSTGYGHWVINDRAPFQPQLVTTEGQEYSDGEISYSHGQGNCFADGAWTWNGKTFVKTSESTRGQCRGIYYIGFWDLPMLVTEVRESPKPSNPETAVPSPKPQGN